MSFKMRLWTTAAAVLTAGTGVLMAPSPAQAIPASCERPPLVSANWGRNKCTGGTGSHRLQIKCVHNSIETAYYYQWSAWIATNQYNYANCSDNYHATTVNYKYELR